jgi:hypothetical protein
MSDNVYHCSSMNALAKLMLSIRIRTRSCPSPPSYTTERHHFSNMHSAPRKTDQRTPDSFAAPFLSSVVSILRHIVHSKQAQAQAQALLDPPTPLHSYTHYYSPTPQYSQLPKPSTKTHSSSHSNASRLPTQPLYTTRHAFHFPSNASHSIQLPCRSTL